MIIGILGCGGCGGSFLDWTIHYLSGNQINWVLETELKNRSAVTQPQEQIIIDNPMVQSTAHGHLRTHPNTNSLPTVIDYFKSKSNFTPHSFYYADEMKEDQTETMHNQIIKTYPEILFITYQFKDIDIDAIFWLQYEKMASWAHRYNDAMVADTGTKISDYKLWDQREMLSMHYPDCIRGQTVNEKIVDHSNNFPLNFCDFFVDLPKQIDKIFEFLNLKIDMFRYNQWLAVYKKWQQLSGVEFYNDLNLIIDNVLNNKNMDLSKYNMTFAKEVVISSKLLFEHNLSLKSFGLDTIRTNTQSWHDILEKNVYHNLKGIV